MLKGQGKQHVFSEIAFPPFGLIMSVSGDPVNLDLCNITHFSHYKFIQWDIVYMKLPVFAVNTWFPGDFRTVDDVKRDVNENRKVGSLFLNPQIPATP